MYVISKDFSFSAAHQLDHLPESHQCHRLHGHNYKVRVYLVKQNLDMDGFVRDYGELKRVKEYLDQNLDHRNLNEALHGEVPYTTAECLAYYLFYLFRYRLNLFEILAVGVSETDSTWAWFSENDNIVFGF